MDKKKWEDEYPCMPEAFHLAVQEAVEKNSREPQKHSSGKKLSLKSRFFFLAAAILVLGGLTAVADRRTESFDFAKYLQVDGMENIEDVFQTEIHVKVEADSRLSDFADEGYKEKDKEWEKREDNAPLLEIREIMYDGMRLVIYGEPTESGREYSLNADWLYIHGEGKYPAETLHYEEKEDYYMITVQQNTLELETPFEVTIPLSVYGNRTRYENQSLTFAVDTKAKIEYLEDQEFVFDDYKVEVTELRKSPISLKGKVAVIMTEDQKKAYEEGDRSICNLLLQSDDGTVWEFLQCTDEEQLQSDYNAHNMKWYFHRKLPENESKDVNLYLMAIDKAQMGEKFNIYSMDNCYGKGMKLILE